MQYVLTGRGAGKVVHLAQEKGRGSLCGMSIFDVVEKSEDVRLCRRCERSAPDEDVPVDPVFRAAAVLAVDSVDRASEELERHGRDPGTLMRDIARGAMSGGMDGLIRASGAALRSVRDCLADLPEIPTHQMVQATWHDGRMLDSFQLVADRSALYAAMVSLSDVVEPKSRCSGCSAKIVGALDVDGAFRWSHLYRYAGFDRGRCGEDGVTTSPPPRWWEKSYRPPIRTDAPEAVAQARFLSEMLLRNAAGLQAAGVDVDAALRNLAPVEFGQVGVDLLRIRVESLIRDIEGTAPDVDSLSDVVADVRLEVFMVLSPITDCASCGRLVRRLPLGSADEFSARWPEWVHSTGGRRQCGSSSSGAAARSPYVALGPLLARPVNRWWMSAYPVPQ